MIPPTYFVKALKEQNIDFFTGVPDSLLKYMCAYLTDTCPPENNIVEANEGSAIGLATGYHLATGKIPVVYMQNSGLGNAINPLLSLTDPKIYSIPLLLLIGWRGEPGVKDEPQHIKQGETTISLLQAMDVKHMVLSKSPEIFKEQLEEALNYIHQTHAPFAFVIQKDTFENYTLQNVIPDSCLLSREEAIQTVVKLIPEDSTIVSTTGMISRELFECRETFRQEHKRDFLTVGSMGHASQIALGIALQKKDREIYCFDGDGATLMHMGAIAITASLKPSNYKHILFNNGAHDSVGGQPTVGMKIDIPQIALSCGYRTAYSVSDKNHLTEILEHIKSEKGPVLLEIKVKKGARKNLGRPTIPPLQNKETFIKFLQ